MEISLFNKNGDAVAYMADDYDRTIYLWEGQQVAYLLDDRYVFGTNGKHLGWFIDGVIFNSGGERIGFTAGACPVPPSKEPVKLKKRFKDEIKARWKQNPLPKLEYTLATEDFFTFLKNGQVYNPRMAQLQKK
jgi:hypothetical protein